MHPKPAAVIEVPGLWFKEGLNRIGMLRAQSPKPVIKIRFDTRAPDQQRRAIDANPGNHHPIISHAGSASDRSVRQSLVISMNLREIVGGIRLRVIEEATRSHASAGGSPEISACRDASDQLRAACEDMQNLGAAVGRMPPSPSTPRAKVGARLVRVVQRMLFWYTPQIVRFNMAASSFADQVCLATEKHIAAIQEINSKLTDLSGEVHRGGPACVPASEESGIEAEEFRDSGFGSFIASFQNRCAAGSGDPHVFHELRQMLDLATPVAGPWLDVENGPDRLMWPATDREIDSRFPGNDKRYAIVTALRVLERQAIQRSFGLLRECVRRLLPGGLLLVTGADPASVLAGASEFWEDPRSLRPMPVATVIAMLEHFGLRVVETRNLRAWPEEEQLPLAGLEPISELNARLYAPREYAILARLEIRP